MNATGHGRWRFTLHEVFLCLENLASNLKANRETQELRCYAN